VILILAFAVQNFISTLVVVLLALCGRISVEKLNWKLVRVWLPVNVIFIAMLVSGMYRYRIVMHPNLVAIDTSCVPPIYT
jgi:hypothetical protein